MSLPTHTIEITYCAQCNWMLRATWIAQEILHTFDGQIKHILLSPTTGGTYTITLNSQTIWDRKTDNGFPDAKQIKRRIRDHIDPQRDLGHLDR